jgi:hypothetical protein
MTFDEFSDICEEEIALLPDYVQEELTGGVLVDQNAYLHPKRLRDDLYILGTYSSGGIYGKQIVLYYGSFMAVMGACGEEAIRMQIRETIRHEFRHHMETRAGLFWKGTLIEEDNETMQKYYMLRRGENPPEESDSAQKKLY